MESNPWIEHLLLVSHLGAEIRLNPVALEYSVLHFEVEQRARRNPNGQLLGISLVGGRFLHSAAVGVRRSLGSTAAHFAEELPRPLLIEGAAEEARWHLDGGFMEILEPADF